jgi:hypothetical protein
VVNWTNNDNAYHEFLSGAPNALTNVFDSGLMAPGITSNGVTFKNPTTFSYFDRFCNNLVGTINVIPSNQVQQQAITSKPLNSTLPRPLPLPSSLQQPNVTLPRQFTGPQSQLSNFTLPSQTNATVPPQTNATLPKQLPLLTSQLPNSTSSANITGRPSQQPSATTPRPTLGFISKGTINSLISTPTARWIATGSWIMTVDNGSVTFFDTNMTWFNNNGMTSHTHEFRNFKGEIVTVQQPTNDVSLNGIMDVGTNHHLVWKNVPTTISMHAGKTITISVADNATNRHFAGQPILGLVNSFVPCSDVPGANMEVLPSCR